MSISVETTLIDDRLNRYHPYTVDYRATGSGRYRDFGSLDPRDPASCITFARQADWCGNRQELSAVLTAELTRLGAPEASLRSAQLLSKDNTWAIVAGHQPSLFGGPLFLLFKMLSIIKLCRQLNTQDEITFVPIYWNGSEEHNRGEFGRVTIFDREHDLLHLALPPCECRKMAAESTVDDAGELLHEMEKLLPDTEFRNEIIRDIGECLQNDLGETQSRLMLKWFGEEGLIVVEPRMLRRFAVPVIEKALKSTRHLHDLLGEDTQAMVEMGYKQQLPHHEAERTLVYYIDNGERFRLRTAADGYSLERKEKHFEGDSLFSVLRDEPERFSPSAALRPAVQAAVLPVAGYTAGGGELAYHLQLRKLFKHLGVTMPLVIPRAAGTLIKSNLLKTADRIGLSRESILGPGWEWDEVAAASEERGAGQTEAFAAFRERFSGIISDLEAKLKDAGLSNFNELKNEEKRFLGRAEGLEKRFRTQDPVLGEAPRRKYFRLRKFVLPGEKYQELSAWTVYFLALYGKELIPALLDATDPLSEKHHLFEI